MNRMPAFTLPIAQMLPGEGSENGMTAYTEKAVTSEMNGAKR